MNKKFEDVIAEQGRLVYTNEGDSMFPIIRARDLLIIEAVREPLKIGDVPLYKRDSGQYVLHRIVAAKKGKYAMKGDNRTFVEKGVTDRQIIGVLTGIVRNGKTYPVDAAGAKCKDRRGCDLSCVLRRQRGSARQKARRKYGFGGGLSLVGGAYAHRCCRLRA